MRAAGRQSGLFGTIAYRTPLASRVRQRRPLRSRWTCKVFWPRSSAPSGTHAVLEASSHALALDRLWGCHFAVAVFTNLTPRPSRFSRQLSKTTSPPSAGCLKAPAPALRNVGIVNMDDAYGQRLSGLARRTITYGLDAWRASDREKILAQLRGLEFTAETPQRQGRRALAPGGTNQRVQPARRASPPRQRWASRASPSRRAFGSSKPVPGRFERIDLGQPFLVVVDYAHTDDALRNLLATARELHPTGRIITLFGCGGDRDRSKRPLMGEAAGRMSQVVVLTSDNPRGEDPRSSLMTALVGLQRTSAKLLVEPDRERAIEMALDEARSGDIVLLAGKGHETTQVLKDRVLEFDDREVARKFLRLRGYGDLNQENVASGDTRPAEDAMRWTVQQVARALGVRDSLRARPHGPAGRRLD